MTPSFQRSRYVQKQTLLKSKCTTLFKKGYGKHVVDKKGPNTIHNKLHLVPQMISPHDLELLLIIYLPNCQIAGCKSFSVLKWEFWWKSVVVNCPEKEGDGPTLAKRELFPTAAACTIQGKSWEQTAIWTALHGTLTLVYANQIGELWYQGKGQTNISMAYNSLFSCHRKLGTRPRTLEEY
jgi:hypothetical protein